MLMSFRHCKLSFLKISESEISNLSSVMDRWKEELAECRCCWIAVLWRRIRRSFGGWRNFVTVYRQRRRGFVEPEIPERWGGSAYLRAVLEFLVCARDLSRTDSCFAGFVAEREEEV
ncbi:unnamed protein product [Lathyrus oleraceus]